MHTRYMLLLAGPLERVDLVLQVVGFVKESVDVSGCLVQSIKTLFEAGLPVLAIEAIFDIREAILCLVEAVSYFVEPLPERAV
jgi:hypothetical protein